MMKNLLFIICCLFILLVKAQSIEELHNEIDQTVWKPFQAAFENVDGHALNAIYADEVLRVTPLGIDTENIFKQKNLERFKKNRTDGVSIMLDFWFDSRKTNSDTSYEVGFYRIGFTSKNGETDFVYGQFHIVLKKIDDHWKITQDWDTTTINGKGINAHDFEKQEPLKF